MIEQKLGLFETALKMRAFRQQLLSSNLANADTPNYQARDIAFADALQEALQTKPGAGPMELPVMVTHVRHVRERDLEMAAPEVLYQVPDQPSIDGNTVDADQEMKRLAENSLHYQAILTFTARHISGLQQAIQGTTSGG